MEMFYEESDKEIIQDDTNQNKQEVTKKLYSSMKIRIRKYDMPHQHKTGRKTDEERYDKSRNMGFKRNETQV